MLAAVRVRRCGLARRGRGSPQGSRRRSSVQAAWGQRPDKGPFVLWVSGPGGARVSRESSSLVALLGTCVALVLGRHGRWICIEARAWASRLPAGRGRAPHHEHVALPPPRLPDRRPWWPRSRCARRTANVVPHWPQGRGRPRRRRQPGSSGGRLPFWCTPRGAPSLRERPPCV